MAGLTDILRAEHAAILMLIEEARAAGIASRAGFECLRKSKMLIIAHLRKEERDLYPALFSSCDLAHIGDAFSNEMIRLSQMITLFFERFEDPSSADTEFSAELERILGILNMRIAREERILYPAYDQLIAEPA